MGKASRSKRERREAVEFVVGLTACEGTWLERPPAEQERARILAARQELQRHRAEMDALLADSDAVNRFSLEVFRDARFAPLHFDDWVIEQTLERQGEPPVVETDDDPAFSNYLREAVGRLASGRVRRALAAQAMRFLPQYVEAGDIKAALAVEYNIYMTNMSEANTPLLVQMLVGGLARWYEEHEEDSEEDNQE